jgi:ABC-type nitrate/sulfonate/bicarbonate transport system substrate-binding protein
LTDALDRRTFLSRGVKSAAGLALLSTAGVGLLEACSSSKKTTATATTAAGGAGGTTAPKSLGSATLQLSWIKNVEFAGSYIADNKGYYKAQGLDVSLIAGGPSVSAEPLIVAGKSLVGMSSPDAVSTAINQGAPLVIIAAGYQRNPFAVMSLASKPIKTPQEMYGKKVGVQAANEPVWNAFLKINNLDGSKITKVPVQFDPSPLASGTVDAWFSYFTNEPNLLKVKGVDTFVFLLDSFGYSMLNEVYIVKKDSLTDPTKKAQVVALMKGEILGWQDQVKTPELGAQLAVNTYGKDLGLSIPEQTLEAHAQNELVVGPVTQQKGLLYMSADDQAKTVSTLAAGGIKIDAQTLFTTSVLDEIYQGKSSL